MAKILINGKAGTGTFPFALACVCLCFAMAATFMLSLEHLGHLSLPGCGKDSPCAEAIAGRWGTVPVINWPVAFLGFAYFSGALAAWSYSRGGLSRRLQQVFRLGAAISLVFVAIIILEGIVCGYCLLSHAANFGFWALTERSRSPATLSRRQIPAMSVVFLAVSTLLGLAAIRERDRIADRQEGELEEATALIIASDKRRAESAGWAPDRHERPWTGGFTGRYRLGPARAAARMVIITDYQCPDCHRLEKEAMALVTENANVSLSIKHFPMCTDCNPYFHRNHHANACMAARAAEAAGIMQGSVGFFRMHEWLFAQKGSFSESQLRAVIRDFGCDEREFIALMTGEETAAAVRKDIEEATWLGLHYTPMVFINGVELKGIFAPNALTRAVNEVLARDPPERTADLDQPPPALDKCVADWLDQPVRQLPPDSLARTMGTAGAKLRVVIWGDFQEVNTVSVDSLMRAFVAQCTDAQYTFRHYPVNQDCNPQSAVNKHPLACLAARGAEAAGQLGGPAAYWEMHVWLMENRVRLSAPRLSGQASLLGFEPDQFRKAMASQAVARAIDEDCAAAHRLGANSIPYIIVNERFVPRWRLQDAVILERILHEALEQ